SEAEARVFAIRYDAQGRITTIVDPLERSMRFEYGALGRLTKQILPDGRPIHYGYDANGNRASITPPGRPPHSFEYTPVNLIKVYRPPNAGVGGEDTNYAYNADKQLTRIVRSDGKTVELAYDTVGHLETVTIPGGKVRFVFDAKTNQL